MKTRRQALLIAAALAMFAFPLSLAAADTFAGAARMLADKVIAAVGPLEHIELTFRNLASLDNEQATEARKSVENEFRSRGMRLSGSSEATAKIRVTLSENLQSYLWVAEISRGQSHEQAMIVQSRPQKIGTEGSRQRMSMQIRLIFEQETPVLDLASMDEDLLVLDPGHLSLYRKRDDRWEPERTVSIMTSRPWPRDTRGRLSVDGSSVRARLPGISCSGTTKPELVLECNGDESPWPLEAGPAKFESSRNFFVQGSLAPFFSSAGIRETEGMLWIFAGADGRTRLYDGAFQPAGTIAGWGSDIAGVDTACGTRRQLFVTLPGDPAGRGTVQAFEIIRRQAVAVTPPAEFPGPISVLWPVPTREAAIAVARDVTTGRYEAFHLSLDCSH